MGCSSFQARESMPLELDEIHIANADGMSKNERDWLSELTAKETLEAITYGADGQYIFNKIHQRLVQQYGAGFAAVVCRLLDYEPLPEKSLSSN